MIETGAVGDIWTIIVVPKIPNTQKKLGDERERFSFSNIKVFFFSSFPLLLKLII